MAPPHASIDEAATGSRHGLDEIIESRRRGQIVDAEHIGERLANAEHVMEPNSAASAWIDSSSRRSMRPLSGRILRGHAANLPADREDLIAGHHRARRDLPHGGNGKA